MWIFNYVQARCIIRGYAIAIHVQAYSSRKLYAAEHNEVVQHIAKTSTRVFAKLPRQVVGITMLPVIVHDRLDHVRCHGSVLNLCWRDSVCMASICTHITLPSSSD